MGRSEGTVVRGASGKLVMFCYLTWVIIQSVHFVIIELNTYNGCILLYVHYTPIKKLKQKVKEVPALCPLLFAANDAGKIIKAGAANLLRKDLGIMRYHVYNLLSNDSEKILT